MFASKECTSEDETAVLSIWAVSLTMTYSTAVSALPCAGAQEMHSRSVAHVAIYC